MAIPNKLTTAGSGMNRTAGSITNPEYQAQRKNTDEEICRHGGVARNRRRHSSPMSPGRTPMLSGAPGEIRTPDPLLRRQTLYPTELRARRISPSILTTYGLLNSLFL
jgi:hypothetical protein